MKQLVRIVQFVSQAVRFVRFVVDCLDFAQFVNRDEFLDVT